MNNSLRLVVAASVLITRTAGAQNPPSLTPKDSVKAVEHKTLFTNRDLMLAGAFAGLTVAMFPVDRHLADRIQDEDLKGNKFLDRSARGVEWITTPGSFLIGGGMYAVGKFTKSETLADIGWHGTEAILLSSAVTSTLKGILGRARPYVSKDTNPHDFQLLRGFGGGTKIQDYGSGDYQSFPSGHTTTAFAAASAVTAEIQRVRPGAVWIAAPILYGGATLVGLSRMYHNNHWASDVVLGAAVGTFGGLKVVRYSHLHPDNKLDRFMLNVSVSPNREGGGIVSLSLTP
jgi:membrane-associated phospholipid phosphatase